MAVEICVYLVYLVYWDKIVMNSCCFRGVICSILEKYDGSRIAAVVERMQQARVVVFVVVVDD